MDIFYAVIDIICFEKAFPVAAISKISLLDRTCNQIVKPLITRYRRLYNKYKGKFAERFYKSKVINYPLKLTTHEYHYIPKKFLNFNTPRSIIINKCMFEREPKHHYFLSNITLIMNEKRDGQVALFLAPNYISDFLYSREDFHTCKVNQAHLQYKFPGQKGPLHLLNLRLPTSCNQIPLEKGADMALYFSTSITDKILYVMVDVIKHKKDENELLITDITFDLDTGWPIRKTFMRSIKRGHWRDGTPVDYEQLNRDAGEYYRIMMNELTLG